MSSFGVKVSELSVSTVAGVDLLSGTVSVMDKVVLSCSISIEVVPEQAVSTCFFSREGAVVVWARVSLRDPLRGGP